MGKFKSLEDLTKLDEKHRLMGLVCGSIPSLEGMHKFLSKEVLDEETPDEIKGQFNVAKNMALYSYYFYALAHKVYRKTYSIIEIALRVKARIWSCLWPTNDN